MNDTNETPSPKWAVIELMGHGRAAGLVSKDTEYGTPLLRLEVPQHDGTYATQLINPSSIYRMSFCEESIARHAASSFRQPPISEYTIRHLAPPEPDDDDDDRGLSVDPTGDDRCILPDT